MLINIILFVFLLFAGFLNGRLLKINTELRELLDSKIFESIQIKNVCGICAKKITNNKKTNGKNRSTTGKA